MPRGRPPKPVEQKRLTGNPGKRRLPNGAQLAPVQPVAPKDTDHAPKDVFDRVLAAGHAWLGESDLVALSLLRESLEERAELRRAVLTLRAPEYRKGLRELDKQLMAQLSALGFDPTARTRLGLAQVTAESTLERLRAKRKT